MGMLCYFENHPQFQQLMTALQQYMLLLTRSISDKAVGEKRVDLSDLFKAKKDEKKNGKKWKNSSKCAISEKGKKDDNENRNITNLRNNDMTLLQLLAVNALDLTAPASDILVKNRKNNWIQLSGHEGAFAPAGPGTIWKKRPHTDDTEVKAYKQLKDDIMNDLVPKFYKEVEWNEEYYIEMQDLLHNFTDPSVMDIKMGTRTFAELEISNQTARQDLFQKMIKLDPRAVTEDERSSQAVTKLRYMTFREQQSSSSTLGFRIEGMKLKGYPPNKELKLVRTREEVLSKVNRFFAGCEEHHTELIKRLQELREKLEKSAFFRTHEILGSSILIVMDRTNIGAWIIDFAKTFPLPENVSITHRDTWSYGNHEDGYLFGLDNLIKILEEVNCSNFAEDHPSSNPSTSNSCISLRRRLGIKHS